MVGLAIPDREARAAVGHCRHGFALFVMRNRPTSATVFEAVAALRSSTCITAQLSLQEAFRRWPRSIGCITKISNVSTKTLVLYTF